MQDRTLKQRNGAVISRAIIENFKDGFRGQALQAGDAGYDRVRRIWNASIDTRPGLIAQCSETADVVRAVKFARANNLLVAVKSGGHNVAGRPLCDDGIVIDLSRMNAVSVKPGNRVRAQAGALPSDLDRASQVYGLAVPTGIVSKAGIAGLTLGSGAGWLSRKYGLACDNLLSCDVVTADGEIVTANEILNPDLFWALRGGGGNFGIVTSFLYQAHTVSTVLGGFLLYPRRQARTVFRFYRDFMRNAPDELTAYAGLISTPDDMPVVAIMICYCGDLAEGERVLKPMRRFGTSFLDTIGSIPFYAMQKLAEGEGRHERTHNYWRSTFLKELSDRAIDVIIEHGNRARSSSSRIVVRSFGGAIGRVAPDETAFPHRHAKFNVAIEAEWLDPADSSENIVWTCDLSAALQPHSSNGVFLSYLGDDGPEATRRAFGDNYERLVDIKTKYDPENFFSLNQNIEPRRKAERTAV